MRLICKRDERISVCVNRSVCNVASNETDLYSVDLRKSCVREESICNCETSTVTDDVSLEFGSSNVDSQKLYNREETDHVCENPSICDIASIDFYSFTENFLQPGVGFKGEKTTRTSSRENYSVCYDVTEESKPFVEEHLEQLPRTRLASKSREHWEMMLHCERAAFPRAPSNLPLPSREARFYWHLYSTAARNSRFYQKDVNHALNVTLAKLARSQTGKKTINIWNELIRLKTFDRISRKNLINNLERLIRKQNSLESICLEDLSLTPDEGVRLLLALYNSRETMKYVYCWHAFEKMVGISVDGDHFVGSRFYADKKIKKCDWFRAIGCLECLTTLSINYEYIATPTGDLLINLAKKLRQNWEWLQLLCLKEEILLNAKSANNDGVVLIPDEAWKKAHLLAPALKIQYAIIGMPEYDVHKKFFTKSTRIHTFTLSTGVDLRFRQPWFLDCTIKTLCSWYSNTLVYLCLQIWHNRENLDNQLKKLFLNLPLLQVFEFIGEIRTLKTLCAMCCQIRSGNCSICRVNMQLQEVIHDDVDKENWVKSIKCLMVCFKHDFDRMNVKFDIDFYSF
ncbi:uncharacterized protein LOC143144669 [Ptiloglossa arizonensis]|uniref:uncharacterized protein LOC143144669 n=1 Tax=Ptiloglossa arizonensis TaxID=3350558 RepID=UPI003F9F8C02